MTTCTESEITYRVITGQYAYINGEWFWIFHRGTYPLAEIKIVPDTDETSHWKFWADNYNNLEERY